MKKSAERTTLRSEGPMHLGILNIYPSRGHHVASDPPAAITELFELLAKFRELLLQAGNFLLQRRHFFLQPCHLLSLVRPSQTLR